MLSIDDKFPDFTLPAAIERKETEITQDKFKGNWTILFFYPEDFSFICPTEVTGFESYSEELSKFGANLLGISVDDVQTHINWQDEVDVNYPLASDTNGHLSKQVGVLDESDGRAHRATFILDEDLVVQFAMVTSRNVGRSVEETIRVFKAIQSGRKCPADYNPSVE